MTDGDGGSPPASESPPFTIRWTPSAFRDLEQTHAFLVLRDPAAARAFAGRVRRALKQLEQHPESGPVAEDIRPIGQYRHLVVKQHRLIYMVEELTVVILRVWDSRRDPDDLAIP